jgi:uncharacterized protein YggT (Ycf19 family)
LQLCALNNNNNNERISNVISSHQEEFLRHFNQRFSANRRGLDSSFGYGVMVLTLLQLTRPRFDVLVFVLMPQLTRPCFDVVVFVLVPVCIVLGDCLHPVPPVVVVAIANNDLHSDNAPTIIGHKMMD